jgi:hypothetical protein
LALGFYHNGTIPQVLGREELYLCLKCSNSFDQLRTQLDIGCPQIEVSIQNQCATNFTSPRHLNPKVVGNIVNSQISKSLRFCLNLHHLHTTTTHSKHTPGSYKPLLYALRRHRICEATLLENPHHPPPLAFAHSLACCPSWLQMVLQPSRRLRLSSPPWRQCKGMWTERGKSRPFSFWTNFKKPCVPPRELLVRAANMRITAGCLEHYVQYSPYGQCQ